MIATLHSYSPENVPDTVLFQKEQHSLCIASGEPPVHGDEIVLKCYAPDWDEPEPIVFSLYSLSPEIVADKKIQRWMAFQDLVNQWKSERGSRSTIAQAAMLQSYQNIIGMGDDAIPLIISQLRSEGDRPDQWFWALRAITKQNPVNPADRGNFPKMARAWIGWWESQNGW